MTSTGSDTGYDPYDVSINADPYPVFRRLREEAPLYRNDTYDFYALSRFSDVEAGLRDAATYSSARGAIIELIKADIEMPPGVLIFEDPPVHTVHRSLLSRVFTPKKMQALEPQVRELCAQCLDPLVGAGGFDFVRDLGAQMPMRVIGMLLRYEPPAPHVARYVTRDVEHYGQTVPVGSIMLFLVGAANRDDRRFPDGDRFDIHRDVARLSPTSTVRGWETLPVVTP